MSRLYILEGIITVVWAAMCIFLVPKNYQTAYFLNDEDKAIMKHRAELAESYSGGNGHYTMKDIKEAAKDPKSWGHGVIQIAVVTILYGMLLLLPVGCKGTDLKLRLRNVLANHHQERLPLFHRSVSVPGDSRYVSPHLAHLVHITNQNSVNIWGAIVYAIGAYISEKYNARFLTMVVCAPIGIAGYAILLCDVSARVLYFATYLIATACFLCTGTNIAWLSGNCAPDGKRAASLGILLTLTNIGGVVSGQIYQTGAAPKYTLGHSWSLGCLAFAWIGWWIVRYMYVKREAAKEKLIDGGYVTPAGDYTDRSPEFKYQF